MYVSLYGFKVAARICWMGESSKHNVYWEIKLQNFMIYFQTYSIHVSMYTDCWTFVKHMASENRIYPCTLSVADNLFDYLSNTSIIYLNNLQFHPFPAMVGQISERLNLQAFVLFKLRFGSGPWQEASLPALTVMGSSFITLPLSVPLADARVLLQLFRLYW